MQRAVELNEAEDISSIYQIPEINPDIRLVYKSSIHISFPQAIGKLLFRARL